LLLLLPGWLSAATIVVGPGESLGAAIDTAVSGDTIVLETNDTIVETNEVGKTLNITAGEGFTPILKGDPGQAALTLVGSISDSHVLTIDGITVDVSDPGIGSPGRTLANRPGRSFIFHTGYCRSYRLYYCRSNLGAGCDW